jgi:acyl-CoA thioesterase
MDADALARACADAMWRDDRASVGLGMRLEAVAAAQARLSLTVGEAMVNGHGACHGGCMFALADSALALACNSYGMRALAQHCSITFVRPAHLGGTLVAEFRGHSRTTGEQFQIAEG